jgi:2-C-methyl-D-erythritol 4-phosphate cytidylyltransferase
MISNLNERAAFHALVPAAGSGARMASERPKQYLPLAGHPMIFHALRTLCATARIDHVFVVLAADDAEWSRHDWSSLGPKLVPLFCGGATRADSVKNGLRAAAGRVAEHDWVLVHDAARPCLATWHVDALINAVAGDGVTGGGACDDGGILAIPVADTLKHVGAVGAVAATDEVPAIAFTVPRSGLWQAQTPQMFRHVYLRRALEGSHDMAAITDEASAMEAQGFRPRLVMGDATNLKVTYPLDLRLAGWILQHRGELP